MRFSISPDRSKLVLSVSLAEQIELRAMGSEIHQDSTLFDFCEKLVCNSELDWVRPEWTGDLTDAPMLGVVFWGDDADERSASFVPTVEERWGWTDYQVRSLLEQLRDHGTAVLVGGPVWARS